MKWMLTTLLFFSTFLKADDSFLRTIDSITYRSQMGATVALIKLSDESIWKWMPDMYSENLLRTWSEGDEILIRACNHPGLSLQNLSRPHYCPLVALSFHSYPLFPTIESIDDTTLLLSDGTEWEIEFDFNKRTLNYWSVGDRIIPVRGIHRNLELINLDIPYENKAQVERSIQTTQLFSLEPISPPIEEETNLSIKEEICLAIEEIE